MLGDLEYNAAITGILPDENGIFVVAYFFTHFVPGLGQASMTGKGRACTEETRYSFNYLFLCGSGGARGAGQPG